MRKPVVVLGILVVLVAGCGGQKPEPAMDMPAEPEIKVPERAPYTLGVGDLIEIRFFYYPNYSVTMYVRPDGMVTIPLVGEVEVEGMRPAELERIVRGHYEEILAEPEVSVMVMEFADQRVFVFGEVKSPGVLSLKGSMTMVDAIAHAGGFAFTAQTESVVLMRKDSAGKYVGRKVDVEAMLESEEGDNLYLMPMDVIYVPMSTISKVDTFVDQFFHKINPAWQWYLYGREIVDPEGKYLLGG
jgi:polysaccharide export outer membrane protein